jgi:hypothetical protein
VIILEKYWSLFDGQAQGFSEAALVPAFKEVTPGIGKHPGG